VFRGALLAGAYYLLRRDRRGALWLAALVVEYGLLALGAWLYASVTRPRDRHRLSKNSGASRALRRV
jgi:hypothetical protein